MKSKNCEKNLLLLLLFILIIPTLVFGQNLKSTEPMKSESACDIPVFELVSFTAKKVEGIIYLNWLAKSTVDNYYFVLEKSLNGENYSAIYITKNFITPLNQKLQYSFVDEKNTTSEYTYYKITLHKIETIDFECKMINLSLTNMLENNNNSFIVVSGKKQEIIATISKQ